MSTKQPHHQDETAARRILAASMLHDTATTDDTFLDGIAQLLFQGYDSATLEIGNLARRVIARIDQQELAGARRDLPLDVGQLSLAAQELIAQLPYLRRTFILGAKEAASDDYVNATLFEEFARTVAAAFPAGPQRE